MSELVFIIDMQEKIRKIGILCFVVIPDLLKQTLKFAAGDAFCETCLFVI